MPAEEREALRILAIEPAGFHRNFNTFFLRCLGAIGHVTFVAHVGYLESCAVDSRIDIPAPLLRHKTKLGARWSAIRVLNYILRNAHLDDYDAIVFLAYETISFSLRWPKSRKVFLFEHNNIENTLGSRIKTFFYRNISSNVVHLAFQPRIAQHICDVYDRSTVHIPHPHYRRDVTDSGDCSDTPAPHRSEGRTIIFSPSASTPEPIQERLKKFASTTNGAYFAVCKGTPAEKTDAWEVRPFFDNYEDLMRSCDVVFLGTRFDYHVSGVAYEALSYGKSLVLLDCPFARELHDENPRMVFVINDINDILGVEINPEKIKEDYERFLREHSFDTILAKMEPVILAQDTK